ncbi:MAG TPA: DUF4395 domain-containing protein [Bacilli bacterium]
MKEIPIPYVRTNQAAMVVLIAAGIIFNKPILILVVWAIELVGLALGARGNLFIIIARPFLRKLAQRAEGEAAELQRFNNSIAVFLLSLSVVSILLDWTMAAYIFAGMVAAAALAAILGYCIGCTLYYQLKQWRLRRNARNQQ